MRSGFKRARYITLRICVNMELGRGRGWGWDGDGDAVQFNECIMDLELRAAG